MKTIKIIAAILLAGMLFACASTKESSSARDNRQTAQLQGWQERQQNMQDDNTRSGLTHDEIRKLDEYAEKKVALVCQIKALEKQSEGAISDVEANDIKEGIKSIDQQFTILNQEIEAYCSTEERMQYFNQIFKHKVKRCESQ